MHCTTGIQEVADLILPIRAKETGGHFSWCTYAWTYPPKFETKRGNGSTSQNVFGCTILPYQGFHIMMIWVFKVAGHLRHIGATIS